jgi:hypothetical protein
MAALTAEQLSLIRLNLGAFAVSFTDDAVLQAYYDASVLAGASDPLLGAVAYAFYMLYTGAVNLTDFRQGQTEEKESVIYDRLYRLYTSWSSQAGLSHELPSFALRSIRLGYIDFPEELP